MKVTSCSLIGCFSFTWLFNKTVPTKGLTLGTLCTSQFQLCPICFFCQQNSLCTYILIGNRVHVKSLGIALGLANARPLGRAKFANAPPPRTDMAGNAPAIAQWGGGGTCAQLELTVALSSENFDILDVKNGNPKLIFSLFQCSGLTNSYSGSYNKGIQILLC